MKKEDVPEQKFNRRATDAIHDLIFEGKEVSWKDVVSVMFSMNETLVAVATSLEAHTREVTARLDAQDIAAAKMASKLSSHEVSEMEVFNKTIGGYKVFSRTATIIATIVTVMGGYILKGYLDNLSTVTSNVAVLTSKMAESDTNYRVLETTVTRNTGILIDLTHRFDDRDRLESRRIDARKK